MSDHSPQQGVFSKGDVVEVRNGPYAVGRKAGPCEGVFQRCIDENECEAGTNNCHQYADCVNSEGSFSCTCNRFGYNGDGVLCPPVCGDGWTMPEEGCDDNNTKTFDGCSAGCDVEGGAVCWQPGRTRNTTSACCKTCVPGQYLSGCQKDATVIDGVNSTVDIDLGDCLACPYGKYKNSRGQWDSVCQNFQSCSLGRERLDASSEHD